MVLVFFGGLIFHTQELDNLIANSSIVLLAYLAYGQAARAGVPNTSKLTLAEITIQFLLLIMMLLLSLKLYLSEGRESNRSLPKDTRLRNASLESWIPTLSWGLGAVPLLATFGYSRRYTRSYLH